MENGKKVRRDEGNIESRDYLFQYLRKNFAEADLVSSFAIRICSGGLAFKATPGVGAESWVGICRFLIFWTLFLSRKKGNTIWKIESKRHDSGHDHLGNIPHRV